MKKSAKDSALPNFSSQFEAVKKNVSTCAMVFTLHMIGKKITGKKDNYDIKYSRITSLRLDASLVHVTLNLAYTTTYTLLETLLFVA